MQTRKQEKSVSFLVYFALKGQFLKNIPSSKISTHLILIQILTNLLQTALIFLLFEMLLRSLLLLVTVQALYMVLDPQPLSLLIYKLQTRM